MRDNTYFKETIIEKGVKVDKEFPISHWHKKLFSDNDMSEEVPEADRTFKKLTEVLNVYFRKYNINYCIQKIHFLSQMYAETVYFTKTRESGHNLSYDPYRGRGFLHLTWDSNYKEFGRATGIDILGKNKTKVAMDIGIGAHTAAWFWSVFKKADYSNKANKEKYKEILGKSLNEISLFDDKYIDTISRLVNGGTNAIDLRRTSYLALKNIFNYNECSNNR